MRKIRVAEGVTEDPDVAGGYGQEGDPYPHAGEDLAALSDLLDATSLSRIQYLRAASSEAGEFDVEVCVATTGDAIGLAVWSRETGRALVRIDAASTESVQEALKAKTVNLDALPDLSRRIALRPKEAALALGVSYRHFRTFQHELPHFRAGEAIMIPVEALRRWVCGRATAAINHDAEIDGLLDALEAGR